MNASLDFLTEKQEQALRRMEQMAELRCGRRAWWRSGGMRLLEEILGQRQFFGVICVAIFFSFSVSEPPVGLVIVCSAAYAALCLVYSFVVTPMKRRIEALERSLEEEIKRSS